MSGWKLLVYPQNLVIPQLVCCQFQVLNLSDEVVAHAQSGFQIGSQDLFRVSRLSCLISRCLFVVADIIQKFYPGNSAINFPHGFILLDPYNQLPDIEVVFNPYQLFWQDAQTVRSPLICYIQQLISCWEIDGFRRQQKTVLLSQKPKKSVCTEHQRELHVRSYVQDVSKQFVISSMRPKAKQQNATQYSYLPIKTRMIETKQVYSKDFYCGYYWIVASQDVISDISVFLDYSVIEFYVIYYIQVYRWYFYKKSKMDQDRIEKYHSGIIKLNCLHCSNKQILLQFHRTIVLESILIRYQTN